MFMPLLLLIFLLPSTLSRPPAIATSDVPTAYTPLPFPYLSLLDLFFAICRHQFRGESTRAPPHLPRQLRSSQRCLLCPFVCCYSSLSEPITVNVRPSPPDFNSLWPSPSRQITCHQDANQKIDLSARRVDDNERKLNSRFRQTSYGSTSMARNFQTHLVPFPPAYKVVPQVTPSPQRKL
ncbi:hypothetical protein C8F04DRAFT_1194322 [Mycena alexandri]|uniref:Secreted protein n=1 Tax=Mycena alexandri TaxID=1745969 RepID=A0AAD6S7S3_9AGAR|nr:hypothetical protein C8F04DRAFT_1194322 [Mycena alexandri]